MRKIFLILSLFIFGCNQYDYISENKRFHKMTGNLESQQTDGTWIAQEELKQVEMVEEIEIFQIPIEPPPLPARPSVPVASEDESFDDDITIEDTDFDDFEDWDAPPPMAGGPKVTFIPFDKPPKPKRGLGIRPIYPEIAQEAGIEGTVYIQFFIDKKGNVTEAWIQKGLPNTGLDEAALSSVKKSKWKPAQQRGKKVGVWQTVPVVFTLE